MVIYADRDIVHINCINMNICLKRRKIICLNFIVHMLVNSRTLQVSWKKCLSGLLFSKCTYNSYARYTLTMLCICLCQSTVISEEAKNLSLYF